MEKELREWKLPTLYHLSKERNLRGLIGHMNKCLKQIYSFFKESIKSIKAQIFIDPSSDISVLHDEKIETVKFFWKLLMWRENGTAA